MNCLGEARVSDKSNETTAIPELLDNLNIKGHIITMDAMGTQKEIVKKYHKTIEKARGGIENVSIGRRTILAGSHKRKNGQGLHRSQ